MQHYLKGFTMSKKTVKENAVTTATAKAIIENASAISIATQKSASYEMQKKSFGNEYAKEIIDFKKEYATAYSVEKLKSCRNYSKIASASIKSIEKRNFNFLDDFRKKTFVANAEQTALAFALVTYSNLIVKKYKAYTSIEVCRAMSEAVQKDLKSAYKSYPDSPMHFSMHKLCKSVCMTKYDISNNIFYDKCVASINNMFPLFYKKGMIYTQKEIGEYIPNPDIPYNEISALFTVKEYNALAIQFYTKCISESKKEIIRSL